MRRLLAYFDNPAAEVMGSDSGVNFWLQVVWTTVMINCAHIFTVQIYDILYIHLYSSLSMSITNSQSDQLPDGMIA